MSLYKTQKGCSMQEPDKPRKRSSPLDSESEQQLRTSLETTSVSAAAEVQFGISPDDSDPDEEEILAATQNNIVPPREEN